MAGGDVCWDDIRVFLEYIRSGSVANTARELGISAPTVSRRITALQEAVGVPLLQRTGQGLDVAQGAQTLIEVWQDAERLLVNAPALVSRLSNAQSIHLRFSTTPALATALVFPNLYSYMDRWPNVRLDVDTSVRMVDIGAGQGDIALRYVEPDRGAVVRQRVGALSFNVYCAAAILPDNFRPASSWDELSKSGIRAVTWAASASVSMPQYKLREVLGAQRSSISISEYSGLVDAICNGIGAGILPDVVGRRLAHVVPIVAPGVVSDMPLWLVTAERLVGYRHVMEFRDFLREVVQRETAASAGSATPIGSGASSGL
ncbi:MAG: LysR family transcriptional regulator [Rhodoferax sp.]